MRVDYWKFSALACVAWLVGASFRNGKVAALMPGQGISLGCGFDPWSRQSPVWVPIEGSQSMLLSCIDVSLPSFFFKSNEKMYSGEDKKKIKNFFSWIYLSL